MRQRSSKRSSDCGRSRRSPDADKLRTESPQRRQSHASGHFRATISRISAPIGDRNRNRTPCKRRSTDRPSGWALQCRALENLSQDPEFWGPRRSGCDHSGDWSTLCQWILRTPQCQPAAMRARSLAPLSLGFARCGSSTTHLLARRKSGISANAT